MSTLVVRGDATNLPLPNSSVDLICTSPPYFGLRSYQDGGEHYEGQVGAEATPAEYLDALIACTREWMRVLKPGGSIFINLGDKYAGNITNHSRQGARVSTKDAWQQVKRQGMPMKSLMMLPHRYAIRCIDELRLILRAEIVWAKPNGLPESVADRVRRQHEQVFHFVKQPKYYAAVDEIREPHAPDSLRPTKVGPAAMKGRNLNLPHNPGSYDGPNPLCKLPGSVWSIPTSPLRVPAELGIDHFAAYPPELVRRIVLGWSPREVCTACGEGRRPVAISKRIGTDSLRPPADPDRRKGGHHGMGSSTLGPRGVVATITGYACACPAPLVTQTIEERDEATGERIARTVQVPDPDWTNPAPTTPGVVLDPFGGTGTTALVASVHDRVGISVDLSADYCRLAQWRTMDEKQRAKATGIKAKPTKRQKRQPVAPPIPGQLNMLGEGPP